MAPLGSLAPLARRTTLAPPSLSPPVVPVAPEEDVIGERRYARAVLALIALAGLVLGATFARAHRHAGTSQPRETDTGLPEHWTAAGDLRAPQSPYLPFK